MIIQFTYTADGNSELFKSSPVIFRSWDELFSNIGKNTMIAGAHEAALARNKKVKLLGFTRRYDLERKIDAEKGFVVG